MKWKWTDALGPIIGEMILFSFCFIFFLLLFPDTVKHQTKINEFMIFDVKMIFSSSSSSGYTYSVFSVWLLSVVKWNIHLHLVNYLIHQSEKSESARKRENNNKLPFDRSMVEHCSKYVLNETNTHSALGLHHKDAVHTEIIIIEETI